MKTIRRILLTGASGYLGQFLLESFLLLNDQQQQDDDDDDDTIEYHIYAINRSNPNLKDAIAKYIQQKLQQNQQQPRKVKVTVQVDSLDLGNSNDVVNYIKSLQHPIDVCIHAAAISSPKACYEQPELARRVNVPKPLFDALIDQKGHPITIIAMSTDQVYDGLQPPYNDESTDKPNPPNQYGQTKLEMERYLLDKVKECPHVKLYLLRSSLIFGPNAPFRELGVKTKDTFLHFIASRKDTPTDFYTDEVRCCISVRDVVRIILGLVNTTHNNNNASSGYNGRIYNVGGPYPINRHDMSKSVFEYLGYDNTSCLQPKLKSKLQPQPAIKTPMDLTMNSNKMQQLLSIDTFLNFNDILIDTFGPQQQQQQQPTSFSSS